MIEKFSEIKGFLEEEEGIALYEACKNSFKNGKCVEVGSYCGKSACYIGFACKKVGSKLFNLPVRRTQEIYPRRVVPSRMRYRTVFYTESILEPRFWVCVSQRTGTGPRPTGPTGSDICAVLHSDTCRCRRVGRRFLPSWHRVARTFFGRAHCLGYR